MDEKKLASVSVKLERQGHMEKHEMAMLAKDDMEGCEKMKKWMEILSKGRNLVSWERKWHNKEILDRETPDELDRD